MRLTRNELRSKVLATQKPKSKIVKFFGEDIELRQPLLSDIFKAQENPDRQVSVIQTLIQYAYVPGTDERLFEEADEAVLMSQPFGSDFVAISETLAELTTVNFLDKKPPSSDLKEPSDSQ